MKKIETALNSKRVINNVQAKTEHNPICNDLVWAGNEIQQWHSKEIEPEQNIEAYIQSIVVFKNETGVYFILKMTGWYWRGE